MPQIMLSHLAQIINTLGLCCDILGAVILFKYGFPQPDFNEDVGLALEDETELEDGSTVRQYQVMAKAMKESYVSVSRAGRNLLLIGFVLQIIATWL